MINKIFDSEYQCPEKPANYDDFSDGTSRPGYGKNGYACNAVFSSNVQSSTLLQLYNCKFNSIQITHSGPISVINYIQYESELIFEKCEFKDCAGAYSGAIYNRVQNNCHVKINDCKFEDNRATLESGAICFYGEKLNVNKCTFKNDLGKLNGDEILIHYQGESKENVDSIVIDNNVFVRTEKEDEPSSLIFFENKENKFKFTFSNNRININTEGADVYLFNCNEDDKFSATVSDNFITSSNKENIVGPNIQGNSDAKLDFDFEKDFQSTPSIPDDKITANSMCSVSAFENSEPEVINDRCSYNGNGRDTTLFVDVIKTKFVGFHQTQSGGALRITNCGVKCKNAQFRDCQENPGGGGAIYIKNTISLSNNVDLENLNFVECQAVFGGAIYVYSDSERNSVNIVKCSFSRNSLISGKGSENGGTALYLTVRKGTVNDCTFSETNKGNMIKISNNYDGGRSAVHLDNHKKDDLLLINGCKFEQSKDADSSIFYESFVESSKLSIINCQFKGKLNNDSHYIEGKFLKENEKNFIVNSCSFEQNNKLAISLKFVNENPDRSRSNYFTFITNNLMVVASILAVLAILAVIVAFIVIRSAKNQKSDSNEKEENETNSIEIDEPVN